MARCWNRLSNFEISYSLASPPPPRTVDLVGLRLSSSMADREREREKNSYTQTMIIIIRSPSEKIHPRSLFLNHLVCILENGFIASFVVCCSCCWFLLRRNEIYSLSCYYSFFSYSLRWWNPHTSTHRFVSLFISSDPLIVAKMVDRAESIIFYSHPRLTMLLVYCLLWITDTQTWIWGERKREREEKRVRFHYLPAKLWERMLCGMRHTYTKKHHDIATQTIGFTCLGITCRYESKKIHPRTHSERVREFILYSRLTQKIGLRYECSFWWFHFFLS